MRVFKLKVMAAWLGVLMLAGCTTTGNGTGSSPNGANKVLFAWTSHGGAQGDLTATTVDSGKVFQGRYFQITTETRVEEIGPLWAGPRWHGYREWRYWDDDWPRDRFVTHYSGRVLANLEAEDGQHMRCNFHLRRPASGMAGGGLGRCQLPNGRTIDVNFPAR